MRHLVFDNKKSDHTSIWVPIEEKNDHNRKKLRGNQLFQSRGLFAIKTYS